MKKDSKKNKNKELFEVYDEIIFEEIQTGPQEETIYVPVEFNNKKKDTHHKKKHN